MPRVKKAAGGFQPPNSCVARKVATPIYAEGRNYFFFFAFFFFAFLAMV
jgi:hypothetical protein